MSDYILCHHGIKGQKWGVRRFQKKDGTLTAAGKRRYSDSGDLIIEKGATIGHVTINNKLKLSSNSTYAYTNEHDSIIYKGPFSKYLNKTQNPDGSWNNENNQVYEYMLKTKRELRIPSEKKMFDQFIKSMNESPKENYDYMMTASKRLVDAGIIRNPVLKKNLFEPDSPEKHINALFDVFTTYGLDSVFRSNSQFKLGQSFVKGLESQKYNAILDYHNIGRYNDAEEPIIVFNGKKYLKKSSIMSVSIDEIDGNLNKVIEDIGDMYVQY